MQYRKFGSLDWGGSALGFGCMRLPVLNNDSGEIDEREAARMVRHAIDRGLNYIDTAYPYHRENSERFVGRVLQDGYREKVRLATKLPIWKVNEAEDFDEILDEQLEKLQTDHIDFYLLHGLGNERWSKVRDMGIREWLLKARESGRIRHIGFSFHDELPAFKEIVDAFESWDFCQIQYNYIDIENQAGTEGLKYAAARGMAVVVMEPLLGGRIVNPPDPIQAIWDESPVRRSAADWALQWLWNQPEVSVVLSGMSTFQQVEENLASAHRSGVGTLNAEELALVDRARTKYKELCPVDCTHCDYCQPCPNQVNIPRIFELYNQASMYNILPQSRKQYERMPMETRADMCLDCGECLEKCPQHIEISNWMPVVHEALAA
jgi:predicted aldo/keto reductase-like oxidoreductase